MPPASLNSDDELRLVRLARELAMDMQPLDQLLARGGWTLEQYEQLARWPHFQHLVAAEAESWESALNTHERVKLKAAAMVEDWLPEAHQRLHDRQEPLPAKVETAKLITRLAGMGVETAVVGENTGKFQLVINIGDGRPGVVLNQGEENLPALPHITRAGGP